MKSIIVISTLLFVTASFVGIGNYIRYSGELKEKGLYQPAKKHTQKPVQQENETVQQDQNSVQQEEEIVRQPQLQTTRLQDEQPIQNVAQVEKKKVVKKKKISEPVLQAKKPVTREISYKSFGRGRIEEPEEIEETTKSDSPTPVGTITEEENQ